MGAALMAAAMALPAHAQAPPRAELPIRETVLSDGVRRYSVPVTVGGLELQAGLDTGSTGLRVLPGLVPKAALTESGHKTTYAFGSGLKLDGLVAQADVALGAVQGRASLQDVTTLGCTSAAPDCPAARLPVERFGLMGGVTGEGFKAILGLNMARTPIGNPLLALGVKRWIVVLPRPGETEPGRLILNPGADETRGFAMTPLLANLGWQSAGIHDAVQGCLKPSSSGHGSCGPVLLDTGAANIGLINGGGTGRAFANGGEAVLILGGKTPVATVQFTPGRRDRASRIAARDDPRLPYPAITAGLMPYWAYEVLYDAERAEIGFKPRPPMADGPRAAP